MALMKIQRPIPRLAVPGFDDVENRMRKFFESAFEPELFPQALGLMPATEIFETDDALVLTAELPGMEKKDVDIVVEEGVLIIRGEKLEEKVNGKEGKAPDDIRKFHLVERTYGSFHRAFTLPRTIDANKITADFDKGVLKVIMLKSEETKIKGRKIPIG
jgi:HSP20 family protein